jgi:putative transposase
LVDYKHLVINHKKVYLLCKELGVLRAQRKIFAKAPRKLAKKATVTASDEL